MDTEAEEAVFRKERPVLLPSGHIQSNSLKCPWISKHGHPAEEE
jgi:hypothetical protein